MQVVQSLHCPCLTIPCRAVVIDILILDGLSSSLHQSWIYSPAEDVFSPISGSVWSGFAYSVHHVSRLVDFIDDLLDGFPSLWIVDVDGPMMCRAGPEGYISLCRLQPREVVPKTSVEV